MSYLCIAGCCIAVHCELLWCLSGVSPNARLMAGRQQGGANPGIHSSAQRNARRTTFNRTALCAIHNAPPYNAQCTLHCTSNAFLHQTVLGWKMQCDGTNCTLVRVHHHVQCACTMHIHYNNLCDYLHCTEFRVHCSGWVELGWPIGNAQRQPPTH